MDVTERFIDLFNREQSPLWNDYVLVIYDDEGNEIDYWDAKIISREDYFKR